MDDGFDEILPHSYFESLNYTFSILRFRLIDDCGKFRSALLAGVYITLIYWRATEGKHLSVFITFCSLANRPR